MDSLEHGTSGRRRSDCELEAAIGDRSIDALGELYDRYGRGLYRLAFAVLGDPRLAEEVVYEEFVAVWRKRGRIHQNVGSRLLRFVHRRALELAASTSRVRERGRA